MSKFFVKPEQIFDDYIEIINGDVNHIKNVLRLNIDDKIIICDGLGNDYYCIIKDIKTVKITAVIDKILKGDTEPRLKLTLFQALPKKDKMEWVIQKVVELGIYNIVPVTTNRTIVKIAYDKKMNKKLQRWNKISRSAAEQSGRSVIPKVEEIITFEEAVKRGSKLDKSIIAYENEEQTKLKDVLISFSDINKMGIFVGPEGGFAEEEIKLANENNLLKVTLGHRILRTETASIALTGMIMYEFGEI